MLTTKDYDAIRDELDHCHNPLIFHHDDADGIASFLLLWRYKQAGHGVMVKQHPCVDEKYLPKIDEYGPDKIFIVDLNLVTQEFVDQCKVPIVVIDHHTPIDITGIKYFNPRVTTPNKHIPASLICYHAVKQDLWLAMLGTVGDWFLPKELKKKFIKAYPDLLEEEIIEPDDALFDSKLSYLLKILMFSSKGKTGITKRNIKLWKSIDSPYEILEKKSKNAEKLIKHYELINTEYEKLLKRAAKGEEEDFVIFTYPKSDLSMSGELSNEVLHKYKPKSIMIARKKEDQVNCSLRTTKPISAKKALDKALVGINGRGGGHDQACGCSISKADWPRFVENYKEEILKQKSKKVK